MAEKGYARHTRKWYGDHRRERGLEDIYICYVFAFEILNQVGDETVVEIVTSEVGTVEQFTSSDCMKESELHRCLSHCQRKGIYT